MMRVALFWGLCLAGCAASQSPASLETPKTRAVAAFRERCYDGPVPKSPAEFDTDPEAGAVEAYVCSELRELMLTAWPEPERPKEAP